jgi:glycosyltransferase involved in cell wall biosynthesis
MEPFAISVVVPTRDRPEALGRCLRALAAQDAPAVEIVVVDDGSRDGGAVAEVAVAAGARLLRERGRGPAAARNRGVHAARGAVICFTDDDCEPAPDWARLLASRVRSRGRRRFSAVAGVTLDGAGTVLSAASQAITNSLVAASLDRDNGRLGFAPTCNLACDRELARALPFDESYTTAAGEDRDWCRRAADRGAPPLYEPRAVVRHSPPLGPLGFVRQQIRYGRGSARFRARHGASAETRPRFAAELRRAAMMAGMRVGAACVVAQGLDRAGAALELAARGRREFAAPETMGGRP